MARAIIIGGGIAGPVTAMALQRIGYEPTIYEAFNRTADGVGAFMNIAPNGLDALDCIGLADVVRDAGFHTPAMAFYRHDGRRLTDDVPFDLQSGTGDVTILRSNLYGALMDETHRRGVPVEYNKRIVDAQSVGDTVRATFADGQQVEGDVLIGADGSRSRVRSIVDPEATDLRYVGVLNAWGCLPDYPTGEPRGVIRMFFGRKCFFMYTQAPDGELRWYANPPRPQRPDPAELRGGEPWRAELLELFDDDAMPAAAIIRATPDIPPPFLNLDMPTVDRWYRDRIILIGDAAHATSPTSGSGASMAMEDAVVLAKCLRDYPALDEAFRTYEAARRWRVEAMVAQGERYIQGNISGPVRSLIRNYFVARKFRKVMATGAKPMWAHDHHIDWDIPEVAAV